MILRRLGNKKKLADKIIPHFPSHDIYIEPFFGAGGMFFNKPKARYNFCNDLDSDVFNLFNVISENKNELKEKLALLIEHTDLFYTFKDAFYEDPVKKAVRFLYLSNMSLYGRMQTPGLSCNHSLAIMQSKIDETYKYIQDCKFTNYDFRKLFNNIAIRPGDKDDVFVYADPPYVDTEGNYSGLTIEDHHELIDVLKNTGYRFAVSEFDNSAVIDCANKKSLNIMVIGERRNIKNRRTEILITNYDSTSLFN